MILYLDNEDFFDYHHLQNMTINLTTHGTVIKDRLEGTPPYKILIIDIDRYHLVPDCLPILNCVF